MIIYLVRHGETLWNKEGRLQGSLDSHLSRTGAEQAEKCASFLLQKKIEHIYCSPTKRSLDTLVPLLAQENVPVSKVDGLMECSFGELEGKTYKEAELLYPGFTKKLRNDPQSLQVKNAETMESFFQRINQTFFSIISQAKYNAICIVTHGGVISLIVRLLGYNPRNGHIKMFPIHNGSITTLGKKGDSFTISDFNSIEHLAI